MEAALIEPCRVFGPLIGPVFQNAAAAGKFLRTSLARGDTCAGVVKLKIVDNLTLMAVGAPDRIAAVRAAVQRQSAAVGTRARYARMNLPCGPHPIRHVNAVT